MVNNLRIGTKIGGSFALGLTIIATLGIVIYNSTQNLIGKSFWQTHTYQVVGDLDDLTAKLNSAETNERDYILTGDKSYLDPYYTTLPLIQQDIQHLRTLTADNPNQQRRLDTLQPILERKLATLKETIDSRQNQGLEFARQLVLRDKSQDLIASILRIITEMKNEEEDLLNQRSHQAEVATTYTVDTIIYGIPLSFLVITVIGIYLSRNISKPLQEISQVTENLAAGDLSVDVSAYKRRDEIGVLAKAFNQMIDNLRQTTTRNNEQNWLKSNQAKFSQMLQGQRSLETVARMILSELVPLVEAQQGVFYILDLDNEQPVLRLTCSYAYQERKNLSNRFRLGEGLVGQSALEKQTIILTEAPSDYIRISSGLGEAKPSSIIVLPVLFEEQVVAVIELASFKKFSDIHLRFLGEFTKTLGVVLNSIIADIRTQELLKQSQALTEELQNQQEELQQSNQRLEEQAKDLQASEELLRQQQQELQQSNEELHQLNAELEEKAELLSLQNTEVERKNQQIQVASQELEEKAQELALSSKYKSEFLANMSHELRTPLNSLLILARMLADNVEGNLSNKQVEYSQTIYSAGNDLLSLINDILDLAKIESGTMSMDMNQIRFSDLQDYINRTFNQVAESKGLRFSVELAAGIPETISTDTKRLQQVLKNLLANAFKFTQKGEVRLRIETAKQGWSQDRDTLNQASNVIAFAVSDTGIGISPEKQQVIFEAFQQADGTTSRRYGGTGLGLSISREITRLFGGEIKLKSSLGQGSTFTFYLPVVADTTTNIVNQVNNELSVQVPQTVIPIVNDDRETIKSGDRSLLIVEDDLKFAGILLDIAREYQFKGIIAHSGSVGLALAQQFKPAAVLLDIRLPEMDGWAVLESLKHDTNTRHIPVHVMSVEEGQQRSLQQGAIAYLQKPISSEVLHEALSNIKGFVERRVKNLLVVEDDENQRRSIVELIGNSDVATTAVSTATQALEAIRNGQFDCVVLDLGLPDMNGFELIEQIKQQAGKALPIIIYTGRELTKAEETQLRRLAETVIVKDVRSPERLLDETALFLHRVQASLPAPKRQIIETLHAKDPVLVGKKVLIVDDDVRNIFALTSMLERYQIEVLFAENGRDGIQVLQNNPNINIVLMDIMMPEMDGYETMRLIRQNYNLKLPIIALTAKAMQGDKEKCIEAGASDYISKPVNPEQLVSLLRVWLYR